jgi:hypothetical protein
MDQIKRDFDAFCHRVEVYRENISKPERQKDSCEGAYEGLYKLIQRLKNELRSGALNRQEKNICHEICNDPFLNGLLELRTVATHIQSDTANKRGYLKIYAPSGPPVEISCEVTAGSAFSNNILTLPTSSSGIDRINHLENLNEAKKRIENKLEKILKN